MRLVGLSAMVRVTREFAALDRNSSILPATVLLNGTPAKEVATPLPMSADRQTYIKSLLHETLAEREKAKRGMNGTWPSIPPPSCPVPKGRSGTKGQSGLRSASKLRMGQ